MRKILDVTSEVKVKNININTTNVRNTFIGEQNNFISLKHLPEDSILRYGSYHITLRQTPNTWSAHGFHCYTLDL